MSEDAKKELEQIESPFPADEESPYIFISYAHADRDRVNPIITRLYEQGWLIWYDEGLTIGEDYYECLARHIKNCAVMLLFVTQRSMSDKSYVRKEITYADRSNKPVIKCFLDSDVVLPPDIDLAIGDDRKYPRCVESELEKVLAGIKGLTKFAPREAEEITINSPDEAVLQISDEDEYDADVLNDTTVRLTKYKGSDVDVTVPAVYKGRNVVELKWTFNGNKNIRSVTIPYGVKCIGFYAFHGCTNLTSIVIPSSVTEIGVGAFTFCDSLTSIVIPDSVMEIGGWTFAGCTNLTSIVIPDSVTKIGDGVFDGCTKLTNISVNENNPAYCSSDGILFNKDKTGLIRFPIEKNVRKYLIPDSVTEISKHAFEGCTNLTSIVIPDSVTRIDSDAFWGCTKLTSIVIPDNVTEIGSSAFNGCTGLTSIVIPNSVTKIEWDAFKDCTSST